MNNVSENKQELKTPKFVDIKHSFFLDCGAPIFKTADGQFAFASTLEEFKNCFANLSKKYLRTVNIEIFKNMFKDLRAYYSYPKAEAKETLLECLATIENCRAENIAAAQA